MKFICFTNNLIIANSLDRQESVDTIFVDLEIIGKEKRQGHTSSLISRHTKEDISNMRPIVRRNKLGVRMNPIHQNSLNEINSVIKRGADVLMLPMFKKVNEVNTFLELVNDRCKVDLLFETVESIKNIEKFPLSKIRNIHFGINDLSLELNLPHLYYCFFEEIFLKAASFLKNSNKEFGIGGIGSINAKPIDPGLILNANNTLNSNRLILSRSFLKEINTNTQNLANRSLDFHINSLLKLNKEIISFTDTEKGKMLSELRNQLYQYFSNNS